MERRSRLTLLNVELGQGASEAAARSARAYQVLEAELRPPPVAARGSAAPRLVVVGGGIVGLMSAHYAALAGFQTTVLERRSFGAAASGRNGGGLLALGHALGELHFNRLATELWRDLAAQGLAARFEGCGQVVVAMDDAEAAALAAAATVYAQAGLRVELLTPAELRRHLPGVSPRAEAGLHCPSDAQAYPLDAARALVTGLRAGGAELRPHSEVTGFAVTGGRVTAVRTQGGDVPADVVVVAAGPWTPLVLRDLGWQPPITPRRSQIMVTERLGARVVAPFVTGNGLYLRQTHAGNLLFGAGGKSEPRDFDVSNSLATLKAIARKTVALLPGMADVSVVRGFAGTVELTPDGRPFIGECPTHPNLYVNAGFNGHGFGWSAVAGRVVTALVSQALGTGALSRDALAVMQALSPARSAAMEA